MKRRDFLKGIGKVVAGISVAFGVKAESKEVLTPKVKECIRKLYHWHYTRRPDCDLNLEVLLDDGWITLATIPAGEPLQGYLPIDLNLVGKPSHMRMSYTNIEVKE